MSGTNVWTYWKQNILTSGSVCLQSQECEFGRMWGTCRGVAFTCSTSFCCQQSSTGPSQSYFILWMWQSTCVDCCRINNISSHDPYLLSQPVTPWWEVEDCLCLNDLLIDPTKGFSFDFSWVGLCRPTLFLTFLANFWGLFWASQTREHWIWIFPTVPGLFLTVCKAPRYVTNQETCINQIFESAKIGEFSNRTNVHEVDLTGVGNWKQENWTYVGLCPDACFDVFHNQRYSGENKTLSLFSPWLWSFVLVEICCLCVMSGNHCHTKMDSG